MGFRIKSWTMFGIAAGAVALLFCVGIATYHWKTKNFTHHGDPHHIRSGLDTENHSQYENTHPHAMDHQHKPLSSSTTTEGSAVTLNQTKCVDAEWSCNIRLDPEVHPIHYDLFIHPQTKNGIFQGQVSINLSVDKTVNHIRIHSNGLRVLGKTFSQGNRSIEIQEMLVYEPNEFLVFRFANALAPDSYTLFIEFSGNLTRGIVGLYRSQYLDPTTNRTRYVIGSKFQPTYARRAFPCFDEPGFKSTFSVSLVKATDLVALSNMPISNEEHDKPGKGFTTVHFQKSVPMVTYLVAVAVGDFDHHSANTTRGVPVRVFATRFQADKAKYAIEVAPRMIDFYENYFDIKYPLPKMDIIGIPDFVSGAMEHWGLISFRESNLLYQEGVSSAANKQRIASVLAHEIAHMWFGNLVTLKWWNDLWLNEGFASYCEYKAVDHVHPDWDIETQFVSQDLTPVLSLDAKHSSHPIVQTVAHPDQITEIFDTISYNKGASVIRMLEMYMGSSRFQHGVTKFLKTFSYKNAETSDLWVALETEIGEGSNISFLMDTWTRQMGFPLVRVEIENGQINLTQERYLQNRKSLSNISSLFDYKWEIPLQVSTAGNKTVDSILFHQNERTLTLPFSGTSNWIKVNSGYNGYFRVQYSKDGWEEVRAAYATSFSPIERCGLVDDIFSFAYSAHLSYGIALDFAKNLRDESHLVPWDCGDTHLIQVSSLLENSSPEAYLLFRRYVTNLTSSLYHRFSWTDGEAEKHLDRLLKVKIFSLSCSHGLSACLEKSYSLFQDWIENGTLVPPGLRPIVYKWGMWQSRDDIWEKLWGRYLLESDSQERVRLLSALASTQSPWVIRRYINLAGNESLVRRQDFFTAMKYVALNPVGNPILWSYYRNEYDSLVKRFTINDRYFGKMIFDITSDYSSDIRLREMENFMSLYPEGGAGKRSREAALETVRNNIVWAGSNTHKILDWLKKS